MKKIFTKTISLFPPKSEEKTWGFRVEFGGHDLAPLEGTFESADKYFFDSAVEHLAKCTSLELTKMEGCPCGK